MNGESSAFLIARNGQILLRSHKFFFKLCRNQTWSLCVLRLYISGLNLLRCILVLNLALLLKTLKLIEISGHIVNFLHSARVSALVLGYRVGSCWIMFGFYGRLGCDKGSSGGCACHSCLPSALIQFILQGKNLGFSLCDLVLSLLDFVFDWLVYGYSLLLWGTWLNSKRWCVGGFDNNIGGRFLLTSLLIGRPILILKILLENVVLAIWTYKSVAAKQLLCVEFIVSLEYRNPGVALLSLLQWYEVSSHLAFDLFVLFRRVGEIRCTSSYIRNRTS